MQPIVYVLTLNWNNPSATADFLESCGAITYSNARVVVIDNASVAGSLDGIITRFPTTELIANETNLGFAAGMNVGIRYALRHGADFAFLANNDTVLAPDMLGRLIDAAIEYQADLASPAIYFSDAPDRIWSIGAWRSRLTLEIVQCYRRLDIEHLQTPFVVDYVTGCGMLLSRSCIETVGLFDERFFMYYEDSDYCLRACAAGCKAIIVPQAKMWHRVADSIGGLYSPQERYHMALASIQFFKKNVRSWRWLIVAPWRAASACKTVLRLAKLGYWPSARAYLHGLWSGLQR